MKIVILLIMIVMVVMIVVIFSCQKYIRQYFETRKNLNTIFEDLRPENFEQDFDIAIEKAKQDLPKFNYALQNKSHNSYFLKVGFATPDNDIEYVWLKDISFDGTKYSGYVAQEPKKIENLRKDDLVDVRDRDSIYDWVYIDKNNESREIGAYTKKVLIRQMSPQEILDYLNMIQGR